MCTNTEIVDGLPITSDRTFTGGTALVTDTQQHGVLIVDADNVTIDGGCTTIDGGPGWAMTQRTGFGIRVDGHHNVTIRNFQVNHFRYAIYVSNSYNIRIEKADVSDNYNDAIVDWSYPNWNHPGWVDNAWNSTAGRPSSVGFLAPQPDMAFGGGIYFSHVTDSVIQNVTARHQAVGIDLSNSDRNQILDCNASDNSAWGGYLYTSTHNTISRNQFNNCWRNNDIDSAGLTLDVNSSYNEITYNELKEGPDGFFARDNPPESAPPFSGANDYLYVAYNDASGARDNAFEHTFSAGSILEHNIADNSNYGFWLGYSDGFVIQDNEVKNNRTRGIAIEHGRNHKILGNTFANHPDAALALWADGPNLTPSKGYVIVGNRFSGDHIGLFLSNTTDSSVASNAFTGDATSVYVEASTTNTMLAGNNLASSGVPATWLLADHAPQGSTFVAQLNWWGSASEAAFLPLIYDAALDPTVGVVDHSNWLNAALPSATFAQNTTRGAAPLTVMVDASASQAATGSIASYSWDFGDGTMSTGPTASHTYGGPGTFTIRLTVTDSQNATAQAQRVVTAQ
jgi:parallel beta-helix repeat protein